MIDLLKILVTASGGAGTSTGSAYSPHVNGRILAVHVDHSAGGTGATDTTLVDAEDPAAETIYTKSDSVTDVKIYPRRATQNNAGTNITYDGTRIVYEPYVVCGRLLAAIAQANDGQTATFSVWLDR